MGEAAGELGRADIGARLLVAAESVLTEAGSPSVKDARAMLDTAALAAGWSASELEERRAQASGLNADQTCEWALETAVDFPPAL